MSTIHEMDTTYLNTIFNTHTHTMNGQGTTLPFFSGMRVIETSGLQPDQAMIVDGSLFIHNTPPPSYGTGINITYDWSAGLGAKGVTVEIAERKPTLREVWQD